MAETEEIKNYYNINSTHYLYDKYLPIWNVLKRCYLGGYEFRPILSKKNLEDLKKCDSISFLRRHQSEDPRDFIDRHNASIYTSYMKKIYKTYAMYIFGVKSEIKRTLENSDPSLMGYYEKYIDNIDLAGKHISEMMEEALLKTLTYGICYLLIDHSYIEPDIIRSEQDKKDISPRSWITLLEPQQIVNWRKDKYGNFIWVRILSYEDYYDPDTTIITNKKVYYEWTKEDIKKFNSKSELYNDYPKPNDLGFIPLVTVGLTDFDLSGLPEPFSQDIADLSIEAYNVRSLLQEEYDNATFPPFILSKKDLGIIDAKKRELKKEDEEVIRGVKRGVYVDPESKIIPQYANYPTNTLQFKQEEIKNLYQEIKDIALERSQEIANRAQILSGFSIHQQQNKLFMFIALLAFKMERIELLCWEIIRYWDSMNNSQELIVEYPKDYDSYDSQEARENLKMGLEQIPSPTFKVKASMEWVGELLPKLDSGDRKSIENELKDFYNSNHEKEIAKTDIFKQITGTTEKIIEAETEEEEETFQNEGGVS